MRLHKEAVYILELSSAELNAILSCIFLVKNVEVSPAVHEGIRPALDNLDLLVTLKRGL